MTETLVIEALRSGFVAVDTAAQPRHYQEKLVGSALRQVFNEKTLVREDVFVSLMNSIGQMGFVVCI